MTTSVASDAKWPVAVAENAAGREPNISGHSQPVGGSRSLRMILGLLDDAVWLLLVVLLFPLGILLAGTPVALCVRLLVEIAQRL